MKRREKSVPSKNTTRKKNNGGMTYIELLVALSLLVLIVTMFTPMLLNSYDSIYKAGELTYNSYDARKDIEKGLAYRNDHPILDVATNFEKFGSSINIKARQVISVANGLESLYSNARARLIIVNDSIVMDNQQCQSVRINVKNINKTAFNEAGSANTAKRPGDDEVLFYVHSIYNDRVPLNYDIKVVDSTKYIDIFFNDVDVTMAPIKILAYYKDDFDQVRDVATYLFIEPADMMFVGKTTGDADYFTSAGVEVENKDDGTSTTNFFIAGREMKSDAHIGEGKVLNDVEWVSTFNDSTIKDGYYIMCGENSVVRRLWRARDTSKSPQITYNSVAVNGDAYFQYSWKGDFTDQYAYSAQKGAGDSNYGSSSKGNSESASKDKYSLNGSSHSFAYNGYAGGWSDVYDKHRRISYVVKSSLADAPASAKPENGWWVSAIKRDGYHKDVKGSHTDGLLDVGDGVAYNVSNHTWYQRYTYYDWKRVATVHGFDPLTDSSGNPITGLSFDSNSWQDQKNAKIYGGGVFFRRNGVPEGKGWETDSSNTLGSEKYEDVKNTYDDDPAIAYLSLKIYNNFSFDDLKDNATPAVNTPSTNPINLKSCIGLPGNNADAIYFGTTNANALINQTNATDASDNNNRRNGLLTGYFVVSLGENEKGNPITKLKAYSQSYADNIITQTIKADTHFPVTQLKNETQPVSNWDSFPGDLAFTMGYSSDLYALYNSFGEADVKPLESHYMASNGITSLNDTVRQNIWHTREFYNIVGSDSYMNSVVAVGYNVSGIAQAQYNELYYDGDSDTSSSLLRSYHNSNWEINITEAQLTSNGWKTCEKESMQLYYLNGSGDFWLKLPKQVVASTAAKTLLNDGVISVYNESGATTFTNIYYYRAPNEESVRFNCVSTVAINDNLVGAAIGLSNGKVMLANIGYDGTNLSTNALTAASCPTFSAIPEITSVTAVKAINNDITGTSGKIILAGGVVKDGCKPILRIIDTSAPSTVYKVLLEDVTNVTKITDIVTSKGYVYVSAIKKNSDGTYSGVIYAIEIAALKGVTGVSADSTDYFKPQVDAGGKMVSAWIKEEVYHKAFTTDADGNVVPSGNGTRLPIINSIAALAE